VDARPLASIDPWKGSGGECRALALMISSVGRSGTAGPLGGVFGRQRLTLSDFEFVLVTIAIVAGFAISEILAGWSQPLLARSDAGYSSLRFLASLFLLFLTLRYIWALWGSVRASGTSCTSFSY